ncbi:hypothetical protein ACSMXM_04395 [Pacificimonas sp. ICDLI1SI03]|jgi:hypothetical protein
MRTIFLLAAASLAISACAPSPNYAGGRSLTPGEVPRNEYGAPVFEAMGEAPPAEVRATALPPEMLADIPPAKPLPTQPDRPLP